MGTTCVVWGSVGQRQVGHNRELGLTGHPNTTPPHTLHYIGCRLGGDWNGGGWGMVRAIAVLGVSWGIEDCGVGRGFVKVCGVWGLFVVFGAGVCV